MTELDAGLISLLPASDSGSTAAWGSKRINPRPQSCLCLTWSGCPSNDDNDDDESLLHQQGKTELSKNLTKEINYDTCRERSHAVLNNTDLDLLEAVVWRFRTNSLIMTKIISTRKYRF